MNNIQDTHTGEELIFSSLFTLKKYEVEIPIIQRDYAQGRQSKSKIRNDILDSLFKSLNTNKKLDLNFVYGSVNEDDNGLGKFIPLDGQQRLTTLFLLHWYLAHNDDDFETFKTFLVTNDKSKFTYKTRLSSKEFCDALVSNEFDIKNLLPSDDDTNNALSKTIKNCTWYYLSWDNDPTIKGMLVMLDEIHTKFSKSRGFFNKLLEIENPLITFQFLNLKHLKMTDDLYIKMNARGKELTPFENFKAQFESFLEINYPKLVGLFSNKVDGVWCDLFWDMSINHPDKPSFKIDNQILKYFEFITEMLYHRYKTNEDIDFEFTNFKLIETVYRKKENIDFLISSFELFSSDNNKKYQQNISAFFNGIFSFEYKEGNIALFDKEVNLFEKLIYSGGGLEHQDKLLLYAILNYLIESKETELKVSVNLKDYIRVCRNFIFKITQKGNSTKKSEFVSDLRTSSYSSIINALRIFYDNTDVYKELANKVSLISQRKDNINDEIFKANKINDNLKYKKLIHKLEDHSYLKGDIHNFNLLQTNLKTFENMVTNFYTIFGNINDDIIIRSLLSIDDYSVNIGNCYFGGLWFFGKKEKWNRILVDKDNTAKLQNIFFQYFNKIDELTEVNLDEKLNYLIKQSLEKEDIPNWRKLFLKYPVITKSALSIYSFNDKEYEIELLSGTSLRSYHINTFIKAIIESDKVTSKLKKHCWQKDSYPSLIFLKHSMYMYPVNGYWYINAQSQDITHLKTLFNLIKTDDNSVYKLYNTDNKDFVEIGIDFINEIYK